MTDSANFWFIIILIGNFNKIIFNASVTLFIILIILFTKLSELKYLPTKRYFTLYNKFFQLTLYKNGGSQAAQSSGAKDLDKLQKFCQILKFLIRRSQTQDAA